ncbi:hypothetical protein DPMN_176422 [Dreissena polymorpha]|uniref:Uncharacterized protein n=1 Tax=Dreissena polymorpha TaxID=45954 RepID=A0A9D4IGW7_DREPO|nr:hypothetical protein DPMN_176422 [Dreissena polymorpha]
MVSGASPYFTNAVTTASISVGAIIGTTIYTVSYTDDDVHDISTLSVTMDTHAFFSLDKPGL